MMPLAHVEMQALAASASTQRSVSVRNANTCGACAPEAECCSTGSPAQFPAGRVAAELVRPAHFTVRHHSCAVLCCSWGQRCCWISLAMTHKPTFLSSWFLNASTLNRFCFSESIAISARKTHNSATLAFATLGKELWLFLPQKFSFPLVRLACRALGPQPLVGSKFTALAGRVAYLWAGEGEDVDTWLLFTRFKGCGAFFFCLFCTVS